MTVRLVPESLGELRLEVSSSSDGYGVRMVSANPLVRQMLEGQIEELRQALSRNGIEISGMAVTTDAASDEGSRGYHGNEAPGLGDAPGAATRDGGGDGAKAPSWAAVADGILDLLV